VAAAPHPSPRLRADKIPHVKEDFLAETDRTLTDPLPSLIYWGVGGVKLPNYAKLGEFRHRSFFYSPSFRAFRRHRVRVVNRVVPSRFQFTQYGVKRLNLSLFVSVIGEILIRGLVLSWAVKHDLARTGLEMFSDSLWVLSFLNWGVEQIKFSVPH